MKNTRKSPTYSLLFLKSTSQSAFFNPRVLLAFALCSVGVVLAMLSFAANPPSGIKGSSGDSTGGSLFVDNHAVPFFKGNTGATAPSIPLAPTVPRWSIVQSPNNGSPGTNELFATTCASASDCWAVGYSDIGSGYSTLIERWNGSIWAIVSSPNNSGDNILYGVTCTSTLDCWAAGTYFDDDLFQRTLIEHWNGDVWNIVSSPNRGLSSPPIDVLVGVACISASECWAVGSNDDRNGVGQTLIERWDGISWTIVDSPNPSGSNSFQGVTCASALQSEECWAVGETVTGFGSAQTLIEKWDGSAWSLVSSPNNGMYNDLLGVTCASEADCWAVGYYSGVTNNQTLIQQWNGILWAIVSSPNTSTMQDNYLAAVACASAAQCWAVGYYANGGGVDQTLIEQWDGNFWTIVTSPNPKDAQGSQLLGVTCAAWQCWAAGYYGNGSGVPQTLAEEYVGNTDWGRVTSTEVPRSFLKAPNVTKQRTREFAPLSPL